jgi:cyclic peptide transporter
MKIIRVKHVIFVLLIFAFNQLFASTESLNNTCNDLSNKIDKIYKDAGIPGLSFIVVSEDSTFIKCWGYSDFKNKIAVTSKTLFELGSTSKAFTALAVLKMRDEGLLRLDDNVSKYIPWFKSYYKGKEVQITIEELLHHTSGIPMELVSRIPQGETEEMLERTVRVANGLKLKRLPGKKYEYSTINYDILGLIIANISGISFESYLQKKIFNPLKLEYTSVGTPVNSNIAKGYKISFFSPSEYRAPRFRGNNPAGYVISNGDDIAKWLKYQLSIETNSFEEIIKESHLPNLTVNPYGLTSYALGWQVVPYGAYKIYHEGLNPNFSSFIGFLPDKKLGIAILANSNSNYTAYLGNIILKTLNNEDITEIPEPDSIDKIFSLLSFILMIFIVGIFVLLLWVLKGVIRKERKWEPFSIKSFLGILGGGILAAPFVFSIYLLPKALMDFSWDSVIVWAPSSFYVGSVLFISVIMGVWLLSIVSILIPTKNKHFQSLPLIIILSIMSGLANMVLILILINAIGSDMKIMYLIFYFILALVFYISSRKIVQTKFINISMSIVYELRMKLINKIFLSSYQKFEKINNGRVYTTLNQDTATISNSVNILISLISNLITIVGVFIYLGTISFIATMLILVVITCVGVLYFIVSRKTKILFEQSRDAANVFSSLIDGLLYGFKELSLSGLKKGQYTQVVEASCSELRKKSSLAQVKFVNAFLVGETLLIIVLGTISFIIPFIFPEIPNYKLLGFIMIVLYMIGPINGVLSSIPSIMQIKVSWKRINGFIAEINPDLKLTDIIAGNSKGISIKNLAVKGVIFEYRNGDEDSSFKVGPINLSVNSGEILFIVGGNGSGKSTLAYLLTGLYTADEGFVEINGERVSSSELGDYYSTVFSNHHIFKKLYGIDCESKKEELAYLLKIFHLDEKVNVKNGEFTSIGLSNGQRKRLSLMKCFLEDSPIYLFDEWAADQDPEYKKIFYRSLLPEMKRSGKIVIAITHDDNYFDVADKIVKMDNGKVVDYPWMSVDSTTLVEAK